MCCVLLNNFYPDLVWCPEIGCIQDLRDREYNVTDAADAASSGMVTFCIKDAVNC
jgi:hypothetical protein